MKELSVLISGAGIAGPALAYWLRRAGMTATVVEVSPHLRPGGHAVDFRGPVHRAVLERMDLWDAIHEHQTHQGEHVMLDSHGKPCARMPPLMLSGDVEILRGDLSVLLYERTRDDTEYLFGDAVSSVTDTGSTVNVRFERGRTRNFDLVIGADGLHSRIRALTLGDDLRLLRQYGYTIAGFTMPNILGLARTGVTYSILDRGVSVSSLGNGERARALFCFRGTAIDHRTLDLPGKRRLVEEAFAGVAWEIPRLLAELRASDDLYFDTIASVHVPSYSIGRVALLGDAAWGGTLGGQGTPLAIIGAYVLAGELRIAGGDHAQAFAHYEARMRPYASRCQKGSRHVGGFHAPPSLLALKVRNAYLRLFGAPWFSSIFERIVTASARDFALPEYAWLAPAGAEGALARLG